MHLHSLTCMTHKMNNNHHHQHQRQRQYCRFFRGNLKLNSCVTFIFFFTWQELWLDFGQLWEQHGIDSISSQCAQLEMKSNCFSSLRCLFLGWAMIAWFNIIFWFNLSIENMLLLLFFFLSLTRMFQHIIEREKVGAGIANDRLAECSNFPSRLWKLIVIKFIYDGKTITKLRKREDEKKENESIRKTNEVNLRNSICCERNETCFSIRSRDQAGRKMKYSSKKNPDLLNYLLILQLFFLDSMLILWTFG